jgi:hypothetical protein
MIDFQSSAIIRCPSQLTAIPRHARVLPAGEGRGDGEFFAMEFHVAGEGRQPALMLCPSGASENSRQHACVIYGWVHCPYQPKVPKDRQNPPQIVKPTQGYANLCKATQTPPPGGARSRTNQPKSTLQVQIPAIYRPIPAKNESTITSIEPRKQQAGVLAFPQKTWCLRVLVV